MPNEGNGNCKLIVGLKFRMFTPSAETKALVFHLWFCLLLGRDS